MARKRKNELPSGNVRLKVYDYTDENHKQHYKSFTAPTRALAQAKVDEWKNSRRKEEKPNMTVLDACKQCLAAKKNVLSPSTSHNYTYDLKRIENDSIAHMSLCNLTNDSLQAFVSRLSVKLAPKTVKNTYDLLLTGIKSQMLGFTANVKMPSKRKVELHLPDQSEVQELLSACYSNELRAAVLLAAVGTLRRGEIAALTWKDIDFKNKTITVNKSMVRSGRNEFVIKSPKTYDSCRTIGMPDYVFDLLNKLDKSRESVLGMNPIQIYKRFAVALKHTGLPPFRFHDLRHYAASMMHAEGVPDRYIEARGGWKPGSNVLKRVYENVLEAEMKKQESKIFESQKFKF